MPADTPAPERIQIKHRWTNAVLFECELPVKCLSMSPHMKLGWAAQKAVEVHAYLARANLAGAYLAGADLAGANLDGANLADAYLIDANLAGANLIDADLAGANLDGANLAGAYLAGADLVGANLDGANLADAYLTNADLADANLVRANLARANLAGANLDGANLARANLDGADLAGANLDGANLADANLDGAKIRDDITITRAPLQLYGLAYPVMIFDSHIKIGCELHSIKEWTAFDDIRIAQMDGATARRFWSKHKDTILALSASDKRGETM